MRQFDVYLEVGAKRVFACSVGWPGRCRNGPNEAVALQVLIDCGPRYAAVVRPARPCFEAPARLEEIRVVEPLWATRQRILAHLEWSPNPTARVRPPPSALDSKA